ncbi:MAG: insulinase family protein [Halieaceae bacterium]|jgi:Zn-dependent M16 (insulinase) family peptidase|nr:insulinase family protein [Halieaceae bacterium]
MTDAVQAHPSFDLVRRQHIDSLQLEVQQFQHRKTGALHYHLAANNSENVFLVALRTVPQDSTGVAHILEHTALCGSEHFPVRDPFFLMLRRSLNTFMNAFTSSDWTAYPFASQNPKDFNNLLQVYLDAVFFSNLDPLDFAQEGHRIEFADPDNPDSELTFKGVVFNEMKGAMSSVPSTLWQTLCHHLFPSNTYHFNSGGEPENIPDLSYEQLLAFYRTHYHPSNAIFMTYGDMPAHQHQTQFEERALARFERLDKRIEVPLEQRFDKPLRVQEHYAFDDSGDAHEKTHIVMGWLLGESTDLNAMLEAQLLANVLLDNSASPLQKALETTALGHSPSPLCGLEDSMREMVFVCGIEGSEPDRADALEALVLEVLEAVARDGVPRERLESVLHQLELHQREISGDSYPFGLQLILTALGNATHYADPIEVLNLDAALQQLRERIADPDYIRELARRLLLENPHRVTLVMAPDNELSARRRAKEAERLAALKASLSEEQRIAVVEQARALAERQAQEDDASILPKVTLEDVPRSIPRLEYQESREGGIDLTQYAQGTNGLVYQQALCALPSMDDEAATLLPVYTNILTEVGLGSADYLEVQDRQSAVCGSINAFTSMRGDVEDEQHARGYLVVSAKALARNHQAQAQLMRDTLEQVRFDEHGRLRELVSQQRARRESSITGNGHGLAMAAASAGMSPVAQLSHELSGLEGIRRCKQLDDSLSDSAALETLGERLAGLHASITAMPNWHLLVADAETLADAGDSCRSVWAGYNPDAGKGGARWEPRPVRQTRREIWVANTQVNFCAAAYPTVPVGHADAPALAVLGGFLRNGFLHTAIREKGGAYGGGASHDPSVGAFRFFSYRDPRLAETLADFDQSVRWLLDKQHDAETLEQAILGVISSLDRPSSPAGEAKQDFHNRLFGRDHAQREAYRQRILAVTLDDLRRVTDRYLQPEHASIAVITSQDGKDANAALIERLGLEVQAL